MTLQLAFDGFEPATSTANSKTQHKHCLLFALKPNDASGAMAENIIRGLTASQQLQSGFLEPSSWQLMLARVIDAPAFPQDIADQAIEIATGIRMPPFEIAFDRGMSLRESGNKHTVMLCATPDDSGVMLLARRISAALAIEGIGGRMVKSGFNPKMTIGYATRQIPAFALSQQFYWTAREFVLIHSLLGQQQHAVLGKWPLLD